MDDFPTSLPTMNDLKTDDYPSAEEVQMTADSMSADALYPAASSLEGHSRVVSAASTSSTSHLSAATASTSEGPSAKSPTFAGGAEAFYGGAGPTIAQQGAAFAQPSHYSTGYGATGIWLPAGQYAHYQPQRPASYGNGSINYSQVQGYPAANGTMIPFNSNGNRMVSPVEYGPAPYVRQNSFSGPALSAEQQYNNAYNQAPPTLQRVSSGGPFGHPNANPHGASTAFPSPNDHRVMSPVYNSNGPYPYRQTGPQW